MDTHELLKQRKAKYGDTHKLAGLVIGVLREPFTNMVLTDPIYTHNWVLMLSKLIRILFSPGYTDNYDDLIGYATLCKQIANEQGDSNDNLSTQSTNEQ